jgi:3-isopropylmalate/(R)-2-methylmalate dehydratase small subunit
MQPFTTLTGIVAIFMRDDVNTDQISPGVGSHSLEPNYADQLFRNWRIKSDGTEDPEFALNRSGFRDAKILICGDNFGCGSSRETAVWAMIDYGIRCIVARSFADIYRENCLKNGLLPIVLPAGDMHRLEHIAQEIDVESEFTVDLTIKNIACPDGTSISFDIDDAERNALIEGLDDIGLTEKYDSEISSWERKVKDKYPWLQELIETN